MMRKQLGQCAVVLPTILVLFQSGCGEDNPTRPLEQGRFTLETIPGEPLSLEVAALTRQPYLLLWKDGLKFSYYDDGFNAWRDEAIDSTQAVGCLAIDRSHHFAVAYSTSNEGRPGAVRFNYRGDRVADWGPYQTIAVRQEGPPSVAFDGVGRVHIVYKTFDEAVGYEVRHIMLEGTAWTTPEPIEGGSGTFASSLALDSNDLPHVVYVGRHGFSYAVKEAATGSWRIETITGELGATSWALQLDASDSPHVVFTSGSDAIWYAKRIGGRWAFERVDGPVDPGGAALALAADGAPRLAYYRHVTNDHADLIYASKTSGSWSLEVVIPVGYYPQRRVWLKLDWRGHPYILYTPDYRTSGLAHLQ